MEQLMLLENKGDLQVETRGASMDAEKQINLQAKYDTDTYKWHTKQKTSTSRRRSSVEGRPRKTEKLRSDIVNMSTKLF